MKKKLSLTLSLFIIIGSTLCVSGSCYVIYFAKVKWQRHKVENPDYFITSLIQTGPQEEKLPFTYLADLLDLSTDRPKSLYAVKPKEEEKKLLRSPLIKKARVKKVFPKTLYVDITLRYPIAKIEDFENVALDEEGIIFPLLKDRSLPKIYFGMDQVLLGNKIEEKKWQKAQELLMLFQHYPFLQLQMIDLSKSQEKSLGKREIVIFLMDEMEMDLFGKKISLRFPKYLRMGEKNYSQQLANFLVLRDKIHQDYRKQIRRLGVRQKNITFAPKIIDMRIGELAFVQK